jgi:type III secretion system YscQ/HrcQ family protein
MTQNSQKRLGEVASRRPKRRAVKQRKPVRRIPLKSLEALSAAEVEAANQLLKMLPAPVPGEALLDALGDELERLLGAEHDVFYHTMRSWAGSDFAVRLEEHFVTSFRLAPDPDFGLLIADMNLVGDWLEQLLEDEPPEARSVAPPSARDFGLITFVLMQIVQWLCQRGLPPVTLPTAAPDPELTARRLRKQSEIIEVVYAVTSPRSAGLVRLFVPSDLVRAMEVFVTQAARRQRRRRRLMLTRLGELDVHLPISLAGLSLTRPEASSLRAGDLLMPHYHGLEADSLDDEIAGARLWLDRQHTHFLPCLLRSTQPGRFEVELTDASATTPARQAKHTSGGAKMSEETSPEDNASGEATGVLEAAEVDVEMRVGSLPLPVSMLAQLQSGYVLELERSVDEGVDLVVDGEVIGRGELVNVDGRLGVRVLMVEG